MRGVRAFGVVVAAAVLLGGCGDKGGDGATSATPDKATSAKSSSPGGGSTGKPAGSTPTSVPRSGTSASGPLAPLADLGKQIDDGFKSFLDGKDVAAAFPGWSATAKDEAKLRADLKDGGVASAITANMEFELVLQKGDKDVYYLRTGVVPGEAAFASFEGRAESKVEVTSHEFSAFTGDTAPLKTAGEALFNLVKGADCEKVPIVASDVGEKLGGGPLAAELTKSLGEMKTGVPKTCKEIATAGADKARLRIDDLGLVARGADGKVVGFVSASFELKDGKLAFSLKRFKKL